MVYSSNNKLSFFFLAVPLFHLNPSSEDNMYVETSWDRSLSNQKTIVCMYCTCTHTSSSCTSTGVISRLGYENILHPVSVMYHRIQWHHSFREREREREQHRERGRKREGITKKRKKLINRVRDGRKLYQNREVKETGSIPQLHFVTITFFFVDVEIPCRDNY